MTQQENRPRLLDLFCGAGGAAKGYHDAGFEVVGVDIAPQPHYPYEFIQADAMTYPLDGFDAYHASCPCQGFSLASFFHSGTQDKYLDLIPATRKRLQETGKLYVIENVARSPLIKSIILCGSMFGLRTYRHRHFESNILLFQPEHPRHKVKAAGPGAIAKDGEFWCIGGHFGQKAQAQRVMEIDWMQTVHEIANAIPPAYTRWIALQLREYIRQGEEVRA